MVFTKVLIIKGYKLSKNELKDFLKSIYNEKSIRSKYGLVDCIADFNENAEKKRLLHQIFHPHCCSTGKYYVFGVCVQTYYRVCVRCDKCNEFSLCDKCIGYTSNGNYDVENILDNFTKIDSNHICKYCHNDNRGSFTKCKFCNFKVKDNGNKDVESLFDKCFNDKVYKMFKKEKTLEYFYALDDCLSCT